MDPAHVLQEWTGHPPAGFPLLSALGTPAELQAVPRRGVCGESARSALEQGSPQPAVGTASHSRPPRLLRGPRWAGGEVLVRSQPRPQSQGDVLCPGRGWGSPAGRPAGQFSGSAPGAWREARHTQEALGWAGACSAQPRPHGVPRASTTSSVCAILTSPSHKHCNLDSKTYSGFS